MFYTALASDLDFFAWFYILLLFSLCLVITAIPIAVSYFIYRFIRRKYPKYKSAGIILIAGAIAYTVLRWHFAFYPRDRFFVRLFEESSGTKFPVGSVIISKDAPYPDLHGILSPLPPF